MASLTLSQKSTFIDVCIRSTLLWEPSWCLFTQLVCRRNQNLSLSVLTGRAYKHPRKFVIYCTITIESIGQFRLCDLLFRNSPLVVFYRVLPTFLV